MKSMAILVVIIVLRFCIFRYENENFRYENENFGYQIKPCQCIFHIFVLSRKVAVIFCTRCPCIRSCRHRKRSVPDWPRRLVIYVFQCTKPQKDNFSLEMSQKMELNISPISLIFLQIVISIFNDNFAQKIVVMTDEEILINQWEDWQSMFVSVQLENWMEKL